MYSVGSKAGCNRRKTHQTAQGIQFKINILINKKSKTKLFRIRTSKSFCFLSKSSDSDLYKFEPGSQQTKNVRIQNKIKTVDFV